MSAVVLITVTGTSSPLEYWCPQIGSNNLLDTTDLDNRALNTNGVDNFIFELPIYESTARLRTYAKICPAVFFGAMLKANDSIPGIPAT